MRIWIGAFVFFLASGLVFTANAQLCTGSLSEPIISIDFGSGNATYGPPISTSETTYAYLATNNLVDGQYTITSSPNNGRPEWHTIQDHTEGDENGYMLLVNASNEPGEFYRTRVSGLCENTIFEFSAWAINALPPNICNPAVLPDLRFEIRETNGNLIAFSESGNIPETSSPTWLNFGITFDIGANTEVDVIIINNAPGGCGNDLAIDDIEFRACGDEASITSNLGTVTPFCNEDIPASLTLEAVLQGAVYATPFYQWETSVDGENWTIIPGAVNDEYIVTPLVEGSFYRYRVAGSTANITNSFCSVLSNEIEIAIHPEFEFQINGQTTICDNEELNLEVTGTGGIDNVVWTWPNGETTQENPLSIDGEAVELSELTGEFKAVITDENGCTYLQSHELLTVNESSEESVLIEECEGSVVVIGNEENYTITQTEEITRTIPRLVNGCDSIITYQITAFERFDNPIDTIVCYQSSIIDPNGQPVILTENTTFNYSFLSKNGCDSLVTKNITVPQPVNVVERVCETEQVNLPDGIQITATETFTQTFTIPSLQNPTCDSIINFTLDVGKSSTENIFITGCPYQPVFLPNEDQTQVTTAGTYPFTFSSANGCDSIINYIVNFEIDSCSYEDLCQIRFPQGFSPDGNGINDSFKPLFADYCNYADYELTIFNRWGEQIYKSQDQNELWQPTTDNLQNMYLWHVEYTLILEDGTEQKIENSGKVMLLQ